MMIWLATALAAPPEVVIKDDNSVHGEVVVAAPRDVVHATMADPTWVAAIDAGGTTVEVLETHGDCLVTNSVSPSAFKTVIYKTKRCKTASGFETTLVDSNTFDAYRVSWKLESTGSDTRLVYDIAMDTSMMVPQFVINRSTRKGVLNLLTNLQAHWGDPG